MLMPSELMDSLLHAFLIVWVLMGIMSEIEDLCWLYILTEPNAELMVIQASMMGLCSQFNEHFDQVEVVFCVTY